MGISNFVFVAIIAVIYIVCNAVVEIVKASSKSRGNNKRDEQSIVAIEQSITALEDELDDARQRIEVLERIVTEPKAELERKISSL